MRLDAEGEVAQHLGPETVAQAHILETDHASVSGTSRESPAPAFTGLTLAGQRGGRTVPRVVSGPPPNALGRQKSVAPQSVSRPAAGARNDRAWFPIR